MVEPCLRAFCALFCCTGGRARADCKATWSSLPAAQLPLRRAPVSPSTPWAPVSAVKAANRSDEFDAAVGTPPATAPASVSGFDPCVLERGFGERDLGQVGAHVIASRVGQLDPVAAAVERIVAPNHEAVGLELVDPPQGGGCGHARGDAEL